MLELPRHRRGVFGEEMQRELCAEGKSALLHGRSWASPGALALHSVR